jgi:hypothetical protein
VIGDVVVDDTLLFRILTGDEPDSLRPQGGRLATTGVYYHRLCRALVERQVLGAMSRELAGLEPELARAAVDAVTTLPGRVTLVSLRTLAMPMARLVEMGARLNLLALEALAAAEHLDAELCMAARDVNPRLVAAAKERDVLVRTISD